MNKYIQMSFIDLRCDATDNCKSIENSKASKIATDEIDNGRLKCIKTIIITNTDSF
jgi:hypothetical protein